MNTTTKTFTRLVLLLAVFLMSGCYVHTKFYPVRGPLAMQTPVPVLEAKLDLPLKLLLAPVPGHTYSGNISLALPDGEVCKGRWDEVTTPPVSPLQSEWDSVYGKGFYLSRVLGAQYLQATLRGSRGTILRAEMYARRGPARGVAEDNHGNLYKIAQY